MPDPNFRQQLADALSDFARAPLAEASTTFFGKLGYGSKRRLQFPSLTGLLAQFDTSGSVAEKLPKTGSKSPVTVVQLTSEEIAANSGGQLASLAGSGADLRQIESYLFLTIALPESDYTRTQLADYARAINSLFPQPVLVLFQHGGTISLAITYRRTNKRDASRDVIARKVTLIRDIACAQPHSGHLAILEDFSLPALSRARQRDIRSFADLDDAWRESLSTQLLNREFYREIANWYFWAREHAIFPKDAPLDADGKPSLPLIRLLTRLIFCWFLREKSLPGLGTLIPADLFDSACIRRFLRDSSPEATTYYTGILQNLFFATLNAEMDEPGRPQKRHFIGEGEEDEADEHFNAAVWRNKRLLAKDAETEVETLFRRIPFLNGGLFECLDEPVFDQKGKKTGEKRVDGFSTKPSKQARVPNFLFFGPDQTVDLSGTYGDSSRRQETVRPLLEIFRGYKFTLTENTPIEEEVALDPELLGHVFENLLAAFNPETGTIARKATGSFYTPRVVVDWMVDEALVAYLTGRVPAATEAQVRDLLSWERDTHEIPPETVSSLVDAVDSLKSLDPACGSGAFPMGLLQKLVHLLRKLDPNNKQWRARQQAAVEAMDSSTAREVAFAALEKAFAHDEDDYGRKLYLIENCLYGVDIQPIAVQIAKLRFFIALVVEQTIAPDRFNYGILPLPNLETKIVAANTLLGLRRGQLMLGSNEVRSLEGQLQRVRHDYFTARRYTDKKALRTRDRELCRKLATALASSGECSPADAQRLADWNPYDTNREAPFFDPGWMFGLAVGRQRPSAATLRGNLAAIVNRTAGQMELGAAPPPDPGFDIILGNPPYVRQEELKNVSVTDSAGRPRPLKEVLKEQYECFTGTADLYVYFIERSLQLLRIGGVLSFITSNKYFRAAYGERLRAYLLYATRPRVLLDFGDAPLFTAIAYPCILVVQKTRALEKGGLPPTDKFQNETTFRQLISDEAAASKIRVFPWTPGPPLRDFPAIFEEKSFNLEQRELKPGGWKFQSDANRSVRRRMEQGSNPLGKFTGDLVINGVKSGGKDAFVLSTKERDALLKLEPQAGRIVRRLLKGRDIKRWCVTEEDRWLIYMPWHFPLNDDATITRASKKAEDEFKAKYPATYAHLAQFKDMLSARDQAETGIRYEWYCLARPRPEAEPFFSKPKIAFPDIAAAPCFAWDEGDHAIENTAYLIPGNKWILGVLNSPAVFWYCLQISNTIRGGYVRFIRQYVEQIPIPTASAEEQQWCERLAEALIFLHRPEVAAGAGAAPVSLMAAWFEQWLNGLVYELFFRAELHARHLRLFEETAKPTSAPPALAPLRDDPAKLAALQACFERTYDVNHPLRAMLFSLRSLEPIRIIEGEA